MAANGLMWCGGIQDVGWLGPLLSPCTFESGASALLLVATLVSVLAQGGRLGLIHQLKLQVSREQARQAVDRGNASRLNGLIGLCHLDGG